MPRSASRVPTTPCVRAARACVVLAAAAAAACKAPPEEPKVLEAPRLETTAEVFPGSVLTGTRRSTDDVRLDDFVRLDIELYYIATIPRSMVSLAPHLDAVLDVGEEGVLRPTPRLAQGARIATDANARMLRGLLPVMGPSRAVAVGSERHYLAAGAAAGMRGRRVDPVENVTHGPRRESVALLVDRTERGHTLALEIQGVEPDADSVHLTRELLVLDVAPEVDGAPVVLALPSPFLSGMGAFAVVAALSQPTAEADGEAIAAQVQEGLRAAAERAALATRQPDAAAIALRNLLHAATGLADIGYERDTLVHMASEGEAPLAQDLATVANQDLLMAWGRRAAAAVPEEASDLAPTPQAWIVERAAWAELGERLDQDRLEPYLRGMLARHGGEVGRFPGILGGLLRKSRSCADFAQRLRDENLAFLGTSDPSARLRAFDWLRARGGAPEGFDPMADRDSRRAALKAYQKAREAAAQAATSAASEETGNRS